MGPSKKRIIPLVLGLLFLDTVSQTMVYPSFPDLLRALTGKDLQQASQLYGLLASSYAFAELFGSPILGILSDRWGRKPILVFAAFSSAAAFAVSAMAQQVGVLFAGYAWAGLTSAIMVVTNAVIADTTDPADRAKSYGYLGATMGLGFVIGPAIGALIAGGGLRAPFWLASGVLSVAAVILLLFLPESLSAENRKKRADAAIPPWQALAALRHYPLVKRLAFTILLNGLALQMLISVWVPYCTYRYGFGVAENGWLLAAFGISYAFAQGILVPWLNPKLGNRRSLMIGLCMSVLSYIGYGIAASWVVMVVVTVVGSLGALDEPSLQAVITNEVNDTEQGTVQGALAMIGSLMGIVGPVIGAFLFSHFSGPNAVAEIPGMTFYAGAVCVFVGLLLARSALKSYREPNHAG